MKALAYIPARGGSKRVPRKNVRTLDGVPVLTRVIGNLRGLDLAGIAVSTEDDEIAALATAAGAVTLDRRADRLAADDVGFLELAKEDVPRYAEHFGTSHVLFVLATAALVPTRLFQAAIDAYAEARPALLLAVTHYSVSPYWALVQRRNGRGWQPLFPKESQLSSQRHPKTVVDAGLFFLLDLNRTRTLDSLLEANPLEVFEVPREVAVDVDAEDDWREMEARYKAGTE